jgi:glycosyltransferase involved in cell wall biosynthesis
MKVGIVINETWAFFQEIFDLFQQHHQVELFKPSPVNAPILKQRFQRYQYQRDMDQFARSNQVLFFEWASESLAHFSFRPKQSGIVARLHRYELYQWADKINWENIDQLIVVSQAKKNEIITDFPQLKNKVTVITEAVNLEHFNFQPKSFSKQIGTLCHLSPRKRVYELILAFEESKLYQQGFTLHIGGGKHPKFGDYYTAIHQLVNRLGLEEVIRFYEHVENAKAWYEKIDIFISNSYSEGLQVSPMEAIASGCYCLSHYWDGADELLPSENLFITGQEMNKKIKDYAALPQEIQLQKITDLKNRVSLHFDIKNISKEIVSLVENVGANYQ